MGYDSVCVVCGAGTDTLGPPYLCYESDAKRIATELASEIKQNHVVTLTEMEIALILEEVLHARHNLHEYLGLKVFNPWFDNPARCCTDGAVIIGHFGDGRGYTPCRHLGTDLHPTGDNAELRHVCGWDAVGHFMLKVARRHGQWFPEDCYTDCDNDILNTWTHYSCHAYLEAWLDCPLPPRQGRCGQSLTIMQELYELVHSRKEPPSWKGYLPCIDYGGATAAFDNQWWEAAINCRNGVFHTARSIQYGLRGKELLKPLLEDSRYWMFSEPWK